MDPTPDPGFSRCALMADPNHPRANVTVGGRSYKRKGFTLRANWNRTEKRFALGVVADANEPLAPTLENLRFFADRFKHAGVRAVLTLGGMGRTRAQIIKALDALAGRGLVLLALPGHREDIRAYRKAIAALRSRGRAIIDLAEIRMLLWPEVSLLSVPGHHRHQVVHAGWWGCGFTGRDVAALSLHARGAPKPLLLATHTPTRMTGPYALDLAVGGVHVGSTPLLRLARTHAISIAVMAHVHEAGPAGTDRLGQRPVAPSTWTTELYLSPGSADAMVHRAARGASSRGTAAILEIQRGDVTRARYRILEAVSKTGEKTGDAAL
jgi:hypothetical protein